MLYIIVAAIILILDQAVKYWVTMHVPLNSVPTTLIPKLIGLTNIHNNGAAFGIFKDARWFFVILTIVFTGVVIYILKKQIIKGKLGRWSLIMVMAGGLGNCIDRMINGYVVDMFQFQFTKKFAIFNVADIFITVFGIVFCAYLIFHKEPDDEKSASANKAHPSKTNGSIFSAFKSAGKKHSAFEAEISTGHSRAPSSGKIKADTSEFYSSNAEDIFGNTSSSAPKSFEPENSKSGMQESKAVSSPEVPVTQPDRSVQSTNKKSETEFSLEDIIAEFKDK